MFYTVVVFCIVVSVSEGGRRQAKPCSTSAECRFDQCCLSPAVFRGRRQAGGYCTDRGLENNKCYVRNDQLLGQHSSTLYYNACPCRGGQRCEGTGLVEVPQGEIGKCQSLAPAKRADGSSCATFRDCAADECCVSNFQPIGKKKRAAIAMGGGTCRKLGRSGDSCMVLVTAVLDMNNSCPCASGFTCKGSGFHVMPLGETGTCV